MAGTKAYECAVPGCPKKARVRDWCSMHYERWRTTGQVGEATPRFRQSMTADERFMADIDKSGECWVWKRYITKDGYGRFHTIRGAILAHRYAYELFIGTIPDGMELDHTCHTEALKRGDCEGGSRCKHRTCCNPAHLEVVDGNENSRRARRESCRKGHQLFGNNLYMLPDGERVCRTCNSERGKAYRARKKDRDYKAMGFAT